MLVGVALVSVVVDVPLLARLTTDGGQTHAAMVLLRFLVAVPVGALVGAGCCATSGPVSSRARAWRSWPRGSGRCRRGDRLARRGHQLDRRPRHGGPRRRARSRAGQRRRPGRRAVVRPRHRELARRRRPDDRDGRRAGPADGVGLHRYYEAVAALSPADRTSADALVGAAMVQVETVFAGAALAAGLGPSSRCSRWGARPSGSGRR
ncbi:hypothetical protein [Janibacter melonis]|uniref:hypothetical protein n=1 Tax=Janibacter melonis TaxID=262209 RepID=UPI002094DD9E|nr:hypothetical protein [Janibacter melonis]